MTQTRRRMLTAGVLMLFMTAFFSAAQQTAVAAPQGTLKMAIHWSPSRDWVDPAVSGFTGSAFFTLYMFHDALLKPMAGDMYAPCLAESWTVSPDYKVYEFKLRKGVKFHNGDEMTAEDVVFTFQRYKGGRSKLLLGKIDKLEAVNPYLFRVSFKESFINFLDYFLVGSSTIGYIVPKKYIEKVGDDGYKRNPIGCGPYKFVEFEAGVKIVGEAFEDYWRKTPSVKRLEVYPVKDIATRYAMVKRGEADLSTLMIDVFFEKIKKDPKLQLFTPASPTHRCVIMPNQWDTHSPWSDIRVRKAASLAIDRQSLVDIHTPGAAAISTLGLPDNDETLPRPLDPYDPAQAKKLLAEAGYPNGFDGGEFVPRNGAYFPFGEQVANYWQAIGIRTKVILLDRAAFMAQRKAGKFKGKTYIDIVMNPTTAERMTYYLSPPYWGGYPEIDSLMDKYNKAMDSGDRKKLLKEAQANMYEKRAFLYLTGASCPTAGTLRVKGDPCKIQKPLPVWFPAPMEDLELK